MTDDFVIPEEAVEAGTQAYERGLGPGVHRMEEMVRSILEAALPHLRAHQERPVVEREALLGTVRYELDAVEGRDPSAPINPRDLSLAITDAVEALLDGRTFLPSEPSPDREAVLSAMIAAIYEEGDTPAVRQGMPSAEWTLLRVAADAVLALLPTEAETKALAETASRYGYELGRKEALEEAAAKADWLAEGVINPEKPYNDAFIHACGVVARHIRNLAS